MPSDGTDAWTTELSVSLGDAYVDRARTARDLWPRVELTLSAPGGDRELELVFDEVVGVCVEYVACAVLDALDGSRSLAVPANWYYCVDGEREGRDEGSVVYRPVGDGTVALDVIDLSGDVAPEGGRGRFDEDARLTSTLPVDPVPVAAREQLEAVRDLGEQTLAFYREHGSEPGEMRRNLPGLVRDVELALDAEPPGFEASLDDYEALLLENPTSADVVLGPLRDEWLERHAHDTDVIERLIDERVRSADAEAARSWYKSLTMIDDEITARTLDALAAEPDQCAVGALLLFLWDDDPQFAPPAIRILAEILGEYDALDETREDRDDVRAQIEKRVERSEHPDVRLAAVEALAALDDPEAKAVLESALDDSDEDVRAAAERALEADDT